MQRTEQEQIAALVAPLISESVTEAVIQILLEERSILVSVLTNEISSLLTATLKSYFEEQLASQIAIKAREFEVELQTKIDELKFQHYQQLERLGQAVEQIMTSHSLEEILDEEVLDEIVDDRVMYEEFGQFASLEFESEFFGEDESSQIVSEQDFDLIQSSEPQALDPNFGVEPELNLFDLNGNEPVLKIEVNEFVQSDDVELEPNPVENIEDLSFDDAFNLFAGSSNLDNDFSLNNETTAETEINSPVYPENLDQDNWETLDPFAFLATEEIISTEPSKQLLQAIATDPILGQTLEQEGIPEDDIDLMESLDSDLELNSEIDLESDRGLSLFDLDLDSESISVSDPDQLLNPTDVYLESEHELNLFTESALWDDLDNSLSLDIDESEATLEQNNLNWINASIDDAEAIDPLAKLLDSEQILSTEVYGFDHDLREDEFGGFSETISEPNLETDSWEDPFTDLINDEIVSTEALWFDRAIPADELILSEETSTLAPDLELEPDFALCDPDLNPMVLTSFDEFNQSEENQDLISDNELSLFAEAATIDIFGSVANENEIIFSEQPSGDIWQTSNPFANSEEPQIEQSPEINYECEEEQFFSILDEELAITDLLYSTEYSSSGDRLNLETELEPVISQNPPEINLLEIPDLDISEFADSESTNNFWETSDRPSSPLAISTVTIDNVWHLGIDFGYSALRACLFNQTTNQIYPLSFSGAESISTDIILTGTSGEEIEIQGFQQFLRLGIPYRNESWQPLVKWINNQIFSLKNFQISAQKLLAQIKAASHPELEIADILQNLKTVFFGHPHSWSDAYIFNLKEAVLASELINTTEQVLAIDQAIAFLFPFEFSSEKNYQLFIDSGALTTTVGYTNQGLSGESRFDDLEYAGLGINQDIVLQLLYPKTKDKLPATKFIKSGQPSPSHRNELQQFLLKTEIGIEALAIAEEIKLFFALESDSMLWQGNLGGRPIKISRSELEIKVIQPFIQSINDVIDRLIYGTEPEDITNIAIAGGTMLFPSMQQWLKSKFANAQVTSLPSCNLALGLAITPLHSQYLDINRHQYSDYFLLSEICALNLQEPLSLGTLIKKLQNRGVNAKACGDRLERILSGQLPAGVLPWQEPEKPLIKVDPNLDPQLLSGHLFTQVDRDLYAPIPNYTQILGTYLEMLESSNHQSFSEPLVFPSFAVSI